MTGVSAAVAGARDVLTSPAGVLSFRRNGTTPTGTYRVMRKSMTVAPHLAPRAFRLLVPTPPAPDARPTAGLLDGHDDALAPVHVLRRDGFVAFDLIVAPSTCDALERVARQTPARPMPTPEGDVGPLVFDATAPVAPKYEIPEPALLADPAVQDLVLDPSLRALAAAYLGCDPVCSLVTMWWSVPFAGDANSEIAQLFHEDRDHPSFLKFFFYLTDVDEDHGPHVYVRGSHRGRRPALRADRRFSDDEVRRRYPEADIVHVCGRRGDPLRGRHPGTAQGPAPEGRAAAGLPTRVRLVAVRRALGGHRPHDAERRGPGARRHPPPHLPALPLKPSAAQRRTGMPCARRCSLASRGVWWVKW